MSGTRSRKEIRKILDPIRPGLLRVEDIRAAVRAVAAEEAARTKTQAAAGKPRKKPAPARHDLPKSLS